MRLALVAIAVLFACAKGSTSATTDGNGSGKGDGTGSSADAAIDSRGIDASNGCAVQPCSIDPQCGCTDPNPACDLGSGSANACRPATSTGVEGHTCASATSCAAGYTCVGGGSDFECTKYCNGNGDCMAPRGQCVIQLTDGTNPIPNAVVCSSNCDPSTATNPLCPSGWTCDLFTATYNSTNYNIADCRSAGTAGNGSACTPNSTTASQICIAGYSCVNTGSNVCKKICNKTANTGCTSGTCTSFSTALTIGGTEYGVCL
jgi:hypothetical protein